MSEAFLMAVFASFLGIVGWFVVYDWYDRYKLRKRMSGRMAQIRTFDRLARRDDETLGN